MPLDSTNPTLFAFAMAKSVSAELDRIAAAVNCPRLCPSEPDLAFALRLAIISSTQFSTARNCWRWCCHSSTRPEAAMRKQPDTFKPIAPVGGRDWLTRGFGINRCRCEKCDPPEERAEQSPAVSPTPTVNPDQEPELEIAGTLA